MRRFSLRLGST